MRALKIEDSSVARQWAIETFAAASGKTSDEILSQGLKVSEKVKDVYAKMYHYVDANTLKAYALDPIENPEGVWRLTDHSRGRFVSPEEFFEQAEAQSRLQLPLNCENGEYVPSPTKGRFKCIIETVDIKDDLYVPRTEVHSAKVNPGEKDWLQPLTRDNPHLGVPGHENGNAVQFKQKKSVRVTIVDLNTGETVRSKAHLEELLNK